MMRVEGHFTGREARWLVGIAALLTAGACAPQPEPAAPSPIPAAALDSMAPGHVHPPPARRPPAAEPSPGTDAQFLQDMIAHHAQALLMASLVPARTSRPEIRMLAERMAVSQRDEIAQMQAWLRNRGQRVPPADPAHTLHDADRHAGMPGMLSGAELSQLAESRGVEFDRMFLRLMIRHHEGAVTMVRSLFSRGGGQESQMYAVASEIESDQRMEIDRMQRLLAALPSAMPDAR